MSDDYKPTIRERLTYAISPLSDAEEHHERNNHEAVIKCIKKAKERLMSLAEAVSIQEQLLLQWIDVQRQSIDWYEERAKSGTTYGDSGYNLEAVHYGMTEVLDALEEELRETFGRAK